MVIDLNKLRADFEEFEVEIPLMLEEDLPTFIQESRNYTNAISGFSIKKIEEIEKFFLDIINGLEKIDISEDRFKRIVLAYIGESVIQNAGGNWIFCDDVKHPGFGTPIIKGYKDDDGMGMLPVGVRDRLFSSKKQGIIWDAV
ncbi:MAG: hypothetical protein ACXVHV_08930, partial [Methanobacterium sp.]